MSYTLEQKREALAKGELWWRFPSFGDDFHRTWTLMSNDLQDCLVRDKDLGMPGAEYFIGPIPPRVLSELEGELLEALKAMVSCWRSVCLSHGWDPEHVVEAVRAKAAIQKAEPTP